MKWRSEAFPFDWNKIWSSEVASNIGRLAPAYPAKGQTKQEFYHTPPAKDKVV